MILKSRKAASTPTSTINNFIEHCKKSEWVQWLQIKINWLIDSQQKDHEERLGWGEESQKTQSCMSAKENTYKKQSPHL